MGYMIDKNASNRYKIGDSVEWVSKSGNQYTGEIVRIREDRSEDLYQRGALICVRLEGRISQLLRKSSRPLLFRGVSLVGDRGNPPSGG